MLKQLKVDETSLPVFVALRDAKQHHDANWKTYTVSKQQTAIRLKVLVQEAYFRSKVYLTARAKFITVKVDRPQQADVIQNCSQLEKVNDFVKKNGVQVVSTKNSLLFRLPK